MARLTAGLGEPEKRSPEIAVRVIVSEELMGAAIGELNSRRGYITAIGREGEMGAVLARLPESEYDDLVKVINSEAMGHGRVERV